MDCEVDQATIYATLPLSLKCLFHAMQVDILNPLSSLEWEECNHMPAGIANAQAVLLDDKVYVGGGDSDSNNISDDYKLYVYTHTKDIWTTMVTPVCGYALATYQSTLLLAGGEEKPGFATKKVWDLKKSCSWQTTLPELKIERSNAVAVGIKEHLIVAGGLNNDMEGVSEVEVFNGDHWASAPCLPRACYYVRSALLDRNWYLMGVVGLDAEVYYASVDLLIKKAGLGDSSTTTWNHLARVPQMYSSPAILGGNLLAVGGLTAGFDVEHSSLLAKEVYAYSPYTKSWVHVDSTLTELCACAVVTLPGNQLISMGGKNHYGVTNLVTKGYVKGM